MSGENNNSNTSPSYEDDETNAQRPFEQLLLRDSPLVAPVSPVLEPQYQTANANMNGGHLFSIENILNGTFQSYNYYSQQNQIKANLNMALFNMLLSSMNYPMPLAPVPPHHNPVPNNFFCQLPYQTMYTVEEEPPVDPFSNDQRDSEIVDVVGNDDVAEEIKIEDNDDDVVFLGVFKKK